MSKEKESKQDEHKRKGIIKIGAAVLGGLIIVLTNKNRNNS